MRKLLISNKFMLTACFCCLFSASQADVFNSSVTTPQTITDFYGNPMPVHGASYYNAALAKQNEQSHQALAQSKNTQTENAKLATLRQKMLADSTPNTNAVTPTKKPIQKPVYHPIVKPKPMVIYRTPVSNNSKTSGSVTNFNTSSKNNNSGSSANLGIQY